MEVSNFPAAERLNEGFANPLGETATSPSRWTTGLPPRRVGEFTLVHSRWSGTILFIHSVRLYRPSPVARLCWYMWREYVHAAWGVERILAVIGTGGPVK
eukprot:8128487-Pyramimonas_sp.AAC.1